jgi:hypothetical protein
MEGNTIKPLTKWSLRPAIYPISSRMIIAPYWCYMHSYTELETYKFPLPRWPNSTKWIRAEGCGRRSPYLASSSVMLRCSSPEPPPLTARSINEKSNPKSMQQQRGEQRSGAAYLFCKNGACLVPAASTTVLRSERRQWLVRSPDSRGNGRREESKGIFEGSRDVL